MSAKTMQKYRIRNLLGLWSRTTDEMFALVAEVGDVVFNTDLQIPVVYTLEGWKDFVGNLILHNLFYENFESGTLDNVTVVNDSVNKWMCGMSEKYAGNYSAYISNNDLDAQYTNNVSQVSHIIIPLTLPTSDLIKLSVFTKIQGERNYDYIRIYWTSSAPTAGTLPSSADAISGQISLTDWVEQNIDLTDKAGETGYLVITHRNDGSIGTNPGACADNIRISYK